MNKFHRCLNYCLAALNFFLAAFYVYELKTRFFLHNPDFDMSLQISFLSALSIQNIFLILKSDAKTSDCRAFYYFDRLTVFLSGLCLVPFFIKTKGDTVFGIFLAILLVSTFLSLKKRVIQQRNYRAIVVFCLFLILILFVQYPVLFVKIQTDMLAGISFVILLSALFFLFRKKVKEHSILLLCLNLIIAFSLFTQLVIQGFTRNLVILSFFVVTFLNFVIIAINFEMKKMVSIGTASLLLYLISGIILESNAITNCADVFNAGICGSGYLGYDFIKAVLVFAGSALLADLALFELPFPLKKRYIFLIILTLGITCSNVYHFGFGDLFYLSKMNQISDSINTISNKLSGVIYMNKTPEGASEIYALAVRKAAALCGPDIMLHQYLPKVFERENIQIPNLEIYYFTQGACSLADRTKIRGYDGGGELIEVDYNTATKQIAQPEMVYLPRSGGADVSNWHINADTAMRIVMENGGKELLEKGLSLHEFTFNPDKWLIIFIKYPDNFNSRVSAQYTVDYETGELHKSLINL